MVRIGNGFKDYYYLTEEGQIYNAESRKFLKSNSLTYKLKTEDGGRRSISLPALYEIVYKQPFIRDQIERMEGEIFEYIPATDNKYLISNYGRCISYNQGRTAHLLRANCNCPGGYLRVCIKINGSFKSKLVHQLVAQQFCDRPDEPALQIHHIDFDHTNNRADNLEYLTPEKHIKKHLEHAKEIEKNGSL